MYAASLPCIVHDFRLTWLTTFLWKKDDTGILDDIKKIELGTSDET